MKRIMVKKTVKWKNEENFLKNNNDQKITVITRKPITMMIGIIRTIA